VKTSREFILLVKTNPRSIYHCPSPCGTTAGDMYLALISKNYTEGRNTRSFQNISQQLSRFDAEAHVVWDYLLSGLLMDQTSTSVRL